MDTYTLLLVAAIIIFALAFINFSKYGACSSGSDAVDHFKEMATLDSSYSFGFPTYRSDDGPLVGWPGYNQWRPWRYRRWINRYGEVCRCGRRGWCGCRRRWW